MFPIQFGCSPTDEGFERPLQHRRPIEVPLVIRQFVCPLVIFVYGDHGGARDAFAFDKPRSEIWSAPNRVEWFAAGRGRQLSGWEAGGQLTRSHGGTMRKDA